MTTGIESTEPVSSVACRCSQWILRINTIHIYISLYFVATQPQRRQTETTKERKYTIYTKNAYKAKSHNSYSAFVLNFLIFSFSFILVYCTVFSVSIFVAESLFFVNGYCSSVSTSVNNTFFVALKYALRVFCVAYSNTRPLYV